MPDLLSNLNPEQKQAVTLPRESALILAGAGSGKTRVLTTRIAHLIQSGETSPAGVLAVTFTNKAAREMLTRLSAMLPINTRGMWVGTFHGLCNRLLRTHHRDAGLPQLFQILDSGDQQSLVKRLAKAQGIDEEKYPPRQLQNFINNCKDAGLRANAVEASDDFTRRMVAFYADYDAQCNREGVVDFAELLLRTFELLANHLPILQHYQARFRYILVDEFQDTNKLQYKWIKMLAGSNGCVFAVGDDDQCLPGGMLVTFADGSTKPIEAVKAGDKVLSDYGSGDFRPALVSRVHSSAARGELVEIRTRGGRRLVSTPEHTHFAGYLLGETPRTFFTYLMHKKGVGYRLGTSCVYTQGQARPMVGFRQRAIQEHADETWIVGTHKSENDARFDEISLSLKYGIPTLPFVPRVGGSVRGLVHDAEYIARLFREIDTASGAHRLIRDRHLEHREPHHVAMSRDSRRRNIVVTLCGDRRGASPMHRVCAMGNDDSGRKALSEAGFSVRPAKKGSASWRFETLRADYGQVMALAEKARNALDGRIIFRANLHGRSLPFISAGSVRPGMAMIGGDGELDIVENVKRLPGDRRKVYDIDVHPTHNFIAAGLVTHNSIYRFRGAEVGNMNEFVRDFGVKEVVKLEQNYRSQGHILDAANAIIAQNKARLGKNLWTSEGKGEELRVYAAANDEEEARFVVDEVKQLHREGMNLSDMALLYRSNAQSRVLEHSLFRAGIAYKVYGGLRFFERQEVKHALAYLRLAGNPDDDTAFTRVVNFPPRGIGARSVEQLQDASQGGMGSLMHVARSGLVTGRSGASIAQFIATIDKLRDASETLTLPELVEELLESSRLKEHYGAEKEGQDRLENLNELVNAAALFAEDFDHGLEPAGESQDDVVAAGTPQQQILAAFLSHASLEAGEREAAAGQDALQLMTVHSAKGLEFSAVFISGLEEGLFPHENSMLEDGGIEEERRLMYVAITRARRRLYLSYAGSRMLHGAPRYGIVSRFVEEIPAELTKWIVLPEKQFDFRQQNMSFGRGNGGSWSAGGGRAPRADTDRYRTPPQKAQFEKRPDEHPFAVGQNVRHAKFGDGVVIDFEGRGLDARVQVRFASSGTKWLALQYAKLTAL
ncbi:MAG TPA: UvrD-helicase domain-containing protein [Usitatibacter sp.]|jgi:DNA helicase-2/ATP-dependent DNA helicase PcrA|nr:UvrD-helicase domain-containing protein [Usitatibacter sp.]